MEGIISLFGSFNPVSWSGRLSTNHNTYLSGLKVWIDRPLAVRHKANPDKSVDQRSSRLCLIGSGIRFIDQDAYPDWVLSEDGLRDAGPSLVIPACGIEGRNNFVTKARSFVIAHNGGGRELLAVELSACSSQRSLLLRREVSWQLCGSHLGESFFSKHRSSLEISGFCRAALIFFLLVLCSLGSSHAFGGGNKFISAQSVEMGQDFATTQEKQACDAKPKVETAPPPGAFSRIPPRQPTHDPLPVFVALGAVFLIGFRIASRTHRG